MKKIKGENKVPVPNNDTNINSPVAPFIKGDRHRKESDYRQPFDLH